MISEIKQQMIAAMKAKDSARVSILKFAMGELQAEETRSGSLDEATSLKILKKMVKNNEETLALKEGNEAEQLRFEIGVISEFLPQSLSPEQIAEALAPLADHIKAAGNQGMAMGIAMKHFKASGADVDSKDVAQVIGQIRD